VRTRSAGRGVCFANGLTAEVNTLGSPESSPRDQCLGGTERWTWEGFPAPMSPCGMPWSRSCPCRCEPTPTRSPGRTMTQPSDQPPALHAPNYANLADRTI